MSKIAHFPLAQVLESKTKLATYLVYSRSGSDTIFIVLQVRLFCVYYNTDHRNICRISLNSNQVKTILNKVQNNGNSE